MLVGSYQRKLRHQVGNLQKNQQIVFQQVLLVLRQGPSQLFHKNKGEPDTNTAQIQVSYASKSASSYSL